MKVPYVLASVESRGGPCHSARDMLLVTADPERMETIDHMANRARDDQDTRCYRFPREELTLHCTHVVPFE